MRELLHAAKMKTLHQWDQVSAIRATVAAAGGATPQPPFKFNPLRDDEGRPIE